MCTKSVRLVLFYHFLVNLMAPLTWVKLSDVAQGQCGKYVNVVCCNSEYLSINFHLQRVNIYHHHLSLLMPMLFYRHYMSTQTLENVHIFYCMSPSHPCLRPMIILLLRLIITDFPSICQVVLGLCGHSITCSCPCFNPVIYYYTIYYLDVSDFLYHIRWSCGWRCAKGYNVWCPTRCAL